MAAHRRTSSTIDRLLPRYDVHERHEVRLPVAPERALAAALAVRVGDDPVVRALFRLRGLPPGGSIEGFFRRNGFAELARTPTELVAGGSGRPWRPRDPLRPFADARAGTVRMAFDLRAEPAPGGSLLSTETRVEALDASARRAFRAYWLVVGPFSALIRRRWLRLARKAVAR